MRKIAAASMSVVLVVALAELVLTLAGQRPSSARSVTAEEYERVPGIFGPGQEVHKREIPALAHWIHINSLGLRGPETPLHSERPRVLCVGDSFTFGDFVNEDETLPAQLQAALGKGVELLNGGVGGSTIVDQRIFLERMMVLEPSVVLLLYSENDLQDLVADPVLHARLARNRALRAGPLGAIYRLVRGTALFRLARRVQANMDTQHTADAVQALELGQEALKSGASELPNLYADHVADLERWLGARDVRLVVAAFPWSAHLTRGGTIPAVRAALRERGIGAVDLTPALVASGLAPEELYLLPHDAHPSPTGYRIAARVLVPQLEAALDSRHR